MAIDTLIFDLGNVLIDWNPSYLYDKIFDDRQQKDYFLQHICNMDWHSRQDAGRSVREATQELVREHPQWAEAISAFYTRWTEMFRGPIEGSVQILRELKEKGYKLYALTNWSAELFVQTADDFPFLDLFDGRVMSGEEGLNKPDPKIYRILLQRYAIDPARALFIDDRADNVAAGEGAGIQGIVFTSPGELRKRLESLHIL